MDVGRRDRGQYGGRNVSGARMWLEVGETDDCMVGAMCQDVAGVRRDRGLYGGGSV